MVIHIMKSGEVRRSIEGLTIPKENKNFYAVLQKINEKRGKRK